MSVPKIGPPPSAGSGSAGLPTPIPGMVQSASRCSLPAGVLLGTAFVQMNSRYAHVIAHDCGDLVLRFFNQMVTSVDANRQPSAINVECEIEVPTAGGFADRSATSLRIPVTFNGAAVGSVPAEGYLDSDPVGGYEFTAGQVIYTQTRQTPSTPGTSQMVAAGPKPATVSEGPANVSRYEQVNLNQATLIGSTTSVGVSNGTQDGLGPSAIFGRPRSMPKGVITVWGDSIPSSSNNYKLPWPNKALEALNVPFFNLSYPSQLMGQFAQPTAPAGTGSSTNLGFRNRMKLGQYGDRILFPYGTNDLGTTAWSQAQLDGIKATMIVGWRRAWRRGMKVYHCTVTPRTTSTDVWITAANQTPTASNAARIDFNDWLRAGAPVDPNNVLTPVAVGTPGAIPCPYLNGVVEIADTIEVNAANVLTRNGGRYIVLPGGVAATPDGIHPSRDDTSALMAAALTKAVVGLA